MSEHQPTTQTERERAYGEACAGTADAEFAKRILLDFDHLLAVLDLIKGVAGQVSTPHQSRLDAVVAVAEHNACTARSRESQPLEEASSVSPANGREV